MKSWTRVRSIARYGVVGGAVAFLDIVFFHLLADRAALPYLTVNLIGFLLGTVLNYKLSITFVFASGARFNKPTELALIGIVNIVGLALNQAILMALIEWLGVQMTLAKLLTVASVFIWNYYSRALFVFNELDSSGADGRESIGKRERCESMQP